MHKSREGESISKFACLIKCTQPLQVMRGKVWKSGEVLFVMTVMQILMYMCPFPKQIKHTDLHQRAEMGGGVKKKKQCEELKFS